MGYSIALTSENASRLEKLAEASGQSISSLANQAIEQFVRAPVASEDWKKAIEGLTGMWKDRTDLPDFDEIRNSLDRKVVQPSA